MHFLWLTINNAPYMELSKTDVSVVVSAVGTWPVWRILQSTCTSC